MNTSFNALSKFIILLAIQVLAISHAYSQTIEAGSKQTLTITNSVFIPFSTLTNNQLRLPQGKT